MPKSKSKRKAKSGRGRTHRVLFTPYAIMRHFPMWDEDRQALQLDIEVAYRALRDASPSCSAKMRSKRFPPDPPKS